MNTHTTCRVVFALGLPLLWGCDAGVTAHTDPLPLGIVMLSGDNQPATAGEPLADPFVVRITNGRAGVPNVPVTWTVTTGEGALNDKWSCDQGRGDPVLTGTVSTDAGGVARMWLTPTLPAPITVSAAAGTKWGSPVTFSTDATEPDLRLAVVSASHHEAAADWAWSTEPLVVEVTDGKGKLLSAIPVTWRVASGQGFLGSLGGVCSGPLSSGVLVARTGISGPGPGLSWVEFSPRVFGVSTITAEVAGVPGTLATLTIDATVLVVHFGYDGWSDSTYFSGPNFTSSITVPLGAAIDFLNHDPSARILSTSGPLGADQIDTGVLSQNERFRFTPTLAGTWLFTEDSSGATLAVTVQ